MMARGMFMTGEKMADYPITIPSNARRPEVKEYLQKVLESGQCPFCRGGATHRDQPILATNEHWWLTRTTQPLPNTQEHFMIVPYRHLLNMADATPEEWTSFTELMRWAEKEFKQDGIAYYWRQGDPMITGATVMHLHVQAIIPQGLATVHFGVYKPEADHS